MNNILRNRIVKSLCLVAAALGITAISGGCAVLDSTGGFRARSPRRNGVAAEAEILRVWETGTVVGDIDPVIGMEVRVQPPNGEPPFVGTIPRTLIEMIQIPQFQPGKVIPVRYDPKDLSQ